MFCVGPGFSFLDRTIVWTFEQGKVCITIKITDCDMHTRVLPISCMYVKLTYG